MATTHKIQTSQRVNSANNPLWMDSLRMLLGLFLFVKGVLFLEHTTDVFYIFSSNQELLSAGKAAWLTSLVHIVGGIMIVFGLLTRFALLCQFPVVIGSLLIVTPQRGDSIGIAEVILSLIVAGLLLFFMIVGPGRFSIDNKVLRQPPRSSADD